MRQTKEAVEILDRRYFANSPGLEAELARARESAEIARTLYQMRVDAGLTQREVAKRVGTSASVISRIENDDYEGHSLTMLRRVAAALGQRVQVTFVPVPQGTHPQATPPH